jgi:CheY-like chemotaxis protein
MLILVVEDDENKRTQLLGFLRQWFTAHEVRIARSMKSGLRAIVNGGVDLVLLDMTMPTFDISADEDGGRPQAYAGREILRQMDRRGVHTPVIVFTQFSRFGEGQDDLTLEQLDAELREAHAATYRGHVYYDAAVSGWQEQLAGEIRAVEASRDAGEA